MIAISNRADASSGTANDFLSTVLALKGGTPHLFNFDAIAGDPGTGCTTPGGAAAAPGDALDALVGKTDGGIFLSISDSGWLNDLAPMPPPDPSPNCFFLGSQPDDANGDGVVSDADGELRVLVNGVEVPSSADGQPVWTYESRWIALCFDPERFPAPGSTVDVEYAVACRSW